MTAAPAVETSGLRAVVDAVPAGGPAVGLVAVPVVTLVAVPTTAPVQPSPVVAPPAQTPAVAPPTHIAPHDGVVVPLVRPGRRVVEADPVQRDTPLGDTDGVPCAARPSTGFRHLDGPCRCFVGGPPPVFPTTSDPAAHA